MVPENPSKNRRDIDFPLIVIASLTVALYIISNIMAVKIVYVFGISWFDAGTITFPIVYMLGDVLAEHWGFKITKNIIWLAFSCNVLAVLFLASGILLPVPDYQQDLQNAYTMLFTQVPRITIASFIAFLAGELSNAWSLEKIRNITGKPMLWMRTIGSSVIGHALDTGLFVVLAFAGTAPVRDLLRMFLIQFALKLGLETLFGTPLAYLALHFLNKTRQ